MQHQQVHEGEGEASGIKAHPDKPNAITSALAPATGLDSFRLALEHLGELDPTGEAAAELEQDWNVVWDSDNATYSEVLSEQDSRMHADVRRRVAAAHAAARE